MRYVTVTACVIILGFIFPTYLSAQIKINEFSSAGSSDWVELYNESESSVDLTEYVLRDNTPDNNKKLEGVISAYGFLVVQWNSLNKDGDSVILVDSLQNSQEIVYGTDNLAAPLADQSVGRKEDGSDEWVIFNNPSKAISNNGSHVYETPIPTPTITPSPTKTPTPKKFPTNAKVPTTHKEPTITIAIQINSGASDEAAVKKSSTSSTLGTSDINESSTLNEENMENSNDEGVSLTKAENNSTGISIIGGGIMILCACGILIFKKYKSRISNNI